MLVLGRRSELNLEALEELWRDKEHGSGNVAYQVIWASDLNGLNSAKLGHKAHYKYYPHSRNAIPP
jgi:hypothetical protein